MAEYKQAAMDDGGISNREMQAGEGGTDVNEQADHERGLEPKVKPPEKERGSTFFLKEDETGVPPDPVVTDQAGSPNEDWFQKTRYPTDNGRHRMQITVAPEDSQISDPITAALEQKEPLPAEQFFSQEQLDSIMEKNKSLWDDAVEAMALESMMKLQEWDKSLWDESKAAEAVARAYGTDVKEVYGTPVQKAVLDQVMQWVQDSKAGGPRTAGLELTGGGTDVLFRIGGEWWEYVNPTQSGFESEEGVFRNAKTGDEQVFSLELIEGSVLKGVAGEDTRMPGSDQDEHKKEVPTAEGDLEMASGSGTEMHQVDSDEDQKPVDNFKSSQPASNTRRDWQATTSRRRVGEFRLTGTEIFSDGADGDLLDL